MKETPIDPLIRRQHENEDLASKSSDAAKRALMKLPVEALMNPPEHQLMINADRLAEKKATDAYLDNEVQVFIQKGDEVAAKRAVKDELIDIEKQEKAGKNSDTHVGPIFRGTTKHLVGDSSESVFTKFEDYMIRSREQEIIDSNDKAGEEFISKLPLGTPLPSAQEQKILRDRPGGLFSKEPFDQDRVA